MYVVQCVAFDEFEHGKLEGEPRLTEAFRSDSLEEAMRYWDSYASGANDWEEPFSNQGFSKGNFYRIVEESDA